MRYVARVRSALFCELRFEARVARFPASRPTKEGWLSKALALSSAAVSTQTFASSRRSHELRHGHPERPNETPEAVEHQPFVLNEKAVPQTAVRSQSLTRTTNTRPMGVSYLPPEFFWSTNILILLS